MISTADIVPRNKDLKLEEHQQSAVYSLISCD